MKPESLRMLRRLARTTTLYIVVTGLAVIILTPVFLLVSLSFMSDLEAYNEWPMPLMPAAGIAFRVEATEAGYVLSVRKVDGSFQSLIEGTDAEAMAAFARRKTNCGLTAGELRQAMSEAPREWSPQREWLANYRTFFQVSPGAYAALWRSVYVALVTIGLSLTIGGLAGYAFARYRFVGRKGLKLGVLFVRMFPGVSIAIPMVIILGSIGLYDRPLGLALVYAVGQIGLTVWITASIFLGIPRELEEAAHVFGASAVGAFWHVTLPLALPGLAASAMYAFIASWNETIQALVLTQFNPTFPVVVYQALLDSRSMVHLAAAGSVVMALPAVIFTFLIRRYMVSMWGGVNV